jgi:hypothetical protein
MVPKLVPVAIDTTTRLLLADGVAVRTRFHEVC